MFIYRSIHASSAHALLFSQFGFTLLIILGNIFIFILAPILANTLERHYTFGGKELSVFGKMLGFQVDRYPVLLLI